MNSFSGARLTGVNGTSLTVQLSAKLDSEIISSVSSRLSQQSTFLPWMSSEDFFNNNLSVSPTIVPEEEELDKRSVLMSSGMGLNLAKIDPRQLHDQMVMPKGHEDYKKFKASINTILEIMDSNPIMKARYSGLVSEIIPQVSNTDKKLRLNGSGLSSLKYRKGIFLSLPYIDETQDFDLALNLSHELGHQTLMTYQNYDMIIMDDHDTPVYSAIRECYRPAILSFHAMVAIVHMLEFLILCRNELLKIVCSEYFELQAKELLRKLKLTLKDFNSLRFTSLGKQMMYESVAFSLWSESILCKNL